MAFAVYVGHGGKPIVEVPPGNYEPTAQSNEGGAIRRKGGLLSRIISGSRRASPFVPMPGNPSIAHAQPVAGPYWPASSLPFSHPQGSVPPPGLDFGEGRPLGVPDRLVMMRPEPELRGLGYTPSQATTESANSFLYSGIPWRVPRPFKRAITLFAGPSQQGLTQQDFHRFLPPPTMPNLGYLRGARAVSGILGRQAASAGTVRVPAVFIPRAVQ